MSFLRLSFGLLLMVSSAKAAFDLEKYDNGLYRERGGIGCKGVYVDPTVSIPAFTSELSKEILKNNDCQDLLNLRRCNKCLNRSIKFYEKYASSIDLQQGDWSLIWGFYFKDPKTQQRYELLKDGKLVLGMIHIDDGTKKGQEVFVDAWLAQKPSIVGFGGNFSKKQDTLAVFAKSLSFNTHLREALIFIDSTLEVDQKAVGIILERSPNLEHLKVSHLSGDILARDKGALSDEAMDALAVPLSNHKNIKALNLSGNRITDKGAFILAEGLKRNESLTELSLYRNKVGADGASVLQQGGKSHKSLQFLNIAENHPDNKKTHQHGYWYFKKEL